MEYVQYVMPKRMPGLPRRLLKYSPHPNRNQSRITEINGQDIIVVLSAVALVSARGEVVEATIPIR